MISRWRSGATGPRWTHEFLDKAKEMIDQHDEQVDQALDKAGELAKDKFAGHDAQIDGLIDQAQRTGAGDTTQAPPAGAPQQ